MKNKTIINKILKVLCITSAIAGILLFINLLFGTNIKQKISINKYEKQKQKEVSEKLNNPKYYYEDYKKYKNHADEMLVLYEDNWNNASQEEKAKGAEQVLYLSAGSLNRIGEHKLEIDDLKNTIAQYDYNNNTITIDSTFLYSASSYDVFSCIFHEVYKMYELDCLLAYSTIAEGYKRLEMFAKARAYDEDIKNNVFIDCEYEKTCNKSMETDAQYATERAKNSFFKFIANYQYRDRIVEINTNEGLDLSMPNN